MKKRILVVIMVVALLVMSSMTAFASVDKEALAYELVDNANEEIYQLIEDAQDDADEDVDSIDKIISKLIKDTNKIANKTIKKAAKEDISLFCQLEEVLIGGQIVLIDPLLVGGW